MLQHLIPPDDDNPNPRQNLDRTLMIDEWYVPGGALPAPEPVPVSDGYDENGVPDWWLGDEEASSSFLEAQGIRL